MSECARPAWVKSTADDLWNNNLMIAKRNPDAPVLILEDDVHFLPAVRDYAAHIDTLIASNKCELYSLGMVPLMSWPSSSRDICIVAGGSATAVLFSTAGRQRLVREYGDDPSYKTSKNNIVRFAENFGFTMLHDYEVYFQFHALSSAEPCAVQPMPYTENRQNWNNPALELAINMTGAEEDGTTYFMISHMLGYYSGGVMILMVLFLILVLYFTTHALRCIGVGGTKKNKFP
jgi:hypothetical protein